MNSRSVKLPGIADTPHHWPVRQPYGIIGNQLKRINTFTDWQELLLHIENECHTHHHFSIPICHPGQNCAGGISLLMYTKRQAYS